MPSKPYHIGRVAFSVYASSHDIIFSLRRFPEDCAATDNPFAVLVFHHDADDGCVFHSASVRASDPSRIITATRAVNRFANTIPKSPLALANQLLAKHARRVQWDPRVKSYVETEVLKKPQVRRWYRGTEVPDEFDMKATVEARDLETARRRMQKRLIAESLWLTLHNWGGAGAPMVPITPDPPRVPSLPELFHAPVSKPVS